MEALESQTPFRNEILNALQKVSKVSSCMKMASLHLKEQKLKDYKKYLKSIKMAYLSKWITVR